MALDFLKTKITSSTVTELIKEIESFSGPHEKIKTDSRLRYRVTTLQYRIESFLNEFENEIQQNNRISEIIKMLKMTKAI